MKVTVFAGFIQSCTSQFSTTKKACWELRIPHLLLHCECLFRPKLYWIFLEKHLVFFQPLWLFLLWINSWCLIIGVRHQPVYYTKKFQKKIAPPIWSRKNKVVSECEKRRAKLRYLLSKISLRPQDSGERAIVKCDDITLNSVRK